MFRLSRASCTDFLDEWTQDEKGWLRKFYPPGEEEAYYDLTHPTEKVLLWMESLFEKDFIGTESRVLSVFELLQQLVSGTETDPKKRLAELNARREKIDREIEAVRRGDLPLLDEAAVRDRFQLAQTMARELLSDFRKVESNFRELDRQVRKDITSWNGSRGDLISSILEKREAIL